MADDDRAGARRRRAGFRALVALLFVGVLGYMLFRREWLAAVIIVPFAAAQVYFAIAAARGSDLGYRY